MAHTEFFIHLRCKECDHGMCGDRPPVRGVLGGTVFTRQVMKRTDATEMRKCSACMEASWKNPQMGMFDSVLRTQLQCPNCGNIIYGVESEG